VPNRVLFVDDEVRVLQGLQRMLRALHLDWETTFASSAAEALALLESGAFDVVVSDMRMPDMSGVQLLEEVRRRQPDAVRLILSGQSSEESALSSVGPAHQFLPKPCDAEVLVATIRRACSLRDLLRNGDLRRLLSQVGELPSAPESYFRLVAELKSPGVSVHRVADIVEEDIGMSAKILQFVNSAFFGIRRRVSDPQQAISLLGLSTVTALVLSIKVFGLFDGARGHALNAGALASHSLSVATWARSIARAERTDTQLQDDTFTAALLHDVGKLVLAAHLTDRYAEASQLAARESCPAWMAEREVFGADHAHVGAYLLGLWGFADTIVEAVAYHHEPERCDCVAFVPLTAVHAADALYHQSHVGEWAGAASALSLDYLARLGRAEAVEAWRALDPAAT
jgi:putative nucleotidyltransferase with HDIG domain